MTKLTNSEQFVFEWQYGQLGDSFRGQLAYLIAKGDLNNQAKLAKGFPDEVAGIQSFQTDAGWWQRVEDKAIDAGLTWWTDKTQRMTAKPVKKRRR